MALNRKYAALPDLDSAPDIYETPELTDDNSTVPTTAGRSQSDNEFDDDEDDEDAPEISHSRLRIDEARSRFLPAQVDAQGVDFSDRLNGKRKSYKTSSRRQRILKDGTLEIGDLSEEEEGEKLEKKIARLKREIEEAKEEYGKRKTETNEPVLDQDTDLITLSRALDQISIPPEKAIAARSHPAPAPSKQNGEEDHAPTTQSTVDGATYTVTYAPSYEQSHALAKAADFDRRLVLLEKAIGVTSSAMPELEGNVLPRAIMPTLDTLQNQILTLSEASTSSLDSISRRVRTLTQEAEQLERSRKAAKAAQESLAAGGSPIEQDDSEQTAKINALYGTLPTIEGLSPLLPPLLDRLRSLRAIHADAATASDTLERIEQSQSDMATDIKQWREGLEKIEAAMSEGETAMTANMKVVEGWVKDLEVKVTKLS